MKIKLSDVSHVGAHKPKPWLVRLPPSNRFYRIDSVYMYRLLKDSGHRYIVRLMTELRVNMNVCQQVESKVTRMQVDDPQAISSLAQHYATTGSLSADDAIAKALGTIKSNSLSTRTK